MTPCGEWTAREQAKDKDQQQTGSALNYPTRYLSRAKRENTDRPSASQCAEELGEKITPEIADGWHVDFEAELVDEVAGWANEGRGLAADNAYRGVPADAEVTDLDEQYVEQATPVVEQQLMKAGVRLAELLNALLR